MLFSFPPLLYLLALSAQVGGITNSIGHPDLQEREKKRECNNFLLLMADERTALLLVLQLSPVISPGISPDGYAQSTPVLLHGVQSIAGTGQRVNKHGTLLPG